MMSWKKYAGFYIKFPVIQSVRILNSIPFTVPNGLLTCSQKSDATSYFVPAHFSPHIHNLFIQVVHTVSVQHKTKYLLIFAFIYIFLK